MLLERFQRNREVRERFHREALIMAQVNHPNIVQIFGAGQEIGENLLAGIFLAYRLYLAGPRPDESGTLWRWSLNGYYVDDLYGNTIVLPGKLSAAWMAFFVDAKIVDGAVNSAIVMTEPAPGGGSVAAALGA